MEPHPVPQNILDIEFKLFGSFTLRQFGKILVGCLVALLFFVLPINFFVKAPFIAASIIIGALSALVPRFETWLLGFTKALFISPRYVWIKDKVRYDLLSDTTQIKPDQKTLQKAKNMKKIDISDIPLSKLFAAQKVEGEPEEIGENVREQNFQRVYKQEFANKFKGNATEKNEVLPRQNSNDNKITLEQEIEVLQNQLENLDESRPDYKEKQEYIMMRIAELRSKIKMKGRYVDKNLKNTNEKLVNAKGEALSETSQQIFGVVVDKKDNPIQGAEVIFTNEDTNAMIKCITDNQGKFSTPQKLPEGSFLVQIKYPGIKFNLYRIVITKEKLPVYKFRGS
jgi:hypothetical protein